MNSNLREYKDITVLIADGVADTQNESVIMDGVEYSNEFVGLRRNHNLEAIGRCDLRKDGNLLKADIKVIADVHGRFWPAVGGSIKEMRKRADSVYELVRIEVNEISLCDSPNADSRIQSIEI